MTKETKTENPNEDIHVSQVINNILDEGKDKFSNVLIIGLDDNGTFHFNTNRPNYPFIHWMLNRALFEINLHEKNNTNTPGTE